MKRKTRKKILKVSLIISFILILLGIEINTTLGKELNTEQLKNINTTEEKLSNQNIDGKFVIICILGIIVNIELVSTMIEIFSSKEIFEGGKKLLDKSENSNCKEIPCDGNFDRIYWIASKYKITKLEDLKTGLVSAYLLKWIRNDLISVTKNKMGKFNLDDNEFAIDLKLLPISDFTLEGKISKIFKDASEDNVILETKEFENWCKENYNLVNSVFYELDNEQKNKLLDENKVKIYEKEKRTLLNKKTIKKTFYTKELKEDATKIQEFKNFLLNFNINEEKENVNIEQLEELLEFAQLLGIADKVEKNLKGINIKTKTQNYIDICAISRAMRIMSEHGIKIAWKEELKNISD